MATRSATAARARKLVGCGRRTAAFGAQGAALIHTAWVPQHPGRDDQIFSRANLLPDLEGGVAGETAAERERLQEGADLCGAGKRARALQRVRQRAAHHAVRLSIRPREAEGAP